MKTWKVPMQWVMTEVVEVDAESLYDAIIKAKCVSPPQVSNADVTINSNPKVISDLDYIRIKYNNDQPDDDEN